MLDRVTSIGRPRSGAAAVHPVGSRSRDSDREGSAPAPRDTRREARGAGPVTATTTHEQTRSVLSVMLLVLFVMLLPLSVMLLGRVLAMRPRAITLAMRPRAITPE